MFLPPIFDDTQLSNFNLRDYGIHHMLDDHILGNRYLSVFAGMGILGSPTWNEMHRSS